MGNGQISFLAALRAKQVTSVPITNECKTNQRLILLIVKAPEWIKNIDIDKLHNKYHKSDESNLDLAS